MNRGLVNALIFVAGAAAGSVATYFITKTKIQKTADEKFEAAITEYQNAKEIKRSREQKETDILEKKAPAAPKSDADTYKEVASRYSTPTKCDVDYTAYADHDDSPSEEYPTHERPYVISPDEFGEDYDTVSFIYYEDGIVADDADNIIDEVEDTIGFECLGRIGEYETGCIHVRNDVLKKDYEVLKSLRTYSEVAAQRGIRMEE